MASSSSTNGWREEKINGLVESINASVGAKNWSEVLKLSEKLELILCTTSSDLTDYATNTTTNKFSCCFNEDMGKFAALHLIALYITGDLCGAKFRWKRIPNQSIYKTATNSEVARCWELGKALWKKDKKAVSIMQDALQGNGNNWSDVVKEALVALIEQERAKQYNLTVKAYSSISVDTFATYMGLPQQKAEKLALSKGWTGKVHSILIISNST
uniref:CSN8/PSMD8/EIF3K domain-containing protein n=1 Tax=Aplanochytrium stocchinoi TaxID=215587 RepID=A0A7S3LH17_9STRA